MQQQLDIILPAYNPSEGWQSHTLSIIAELKNLRPEYRLRLIVSADGSKRGHSTKVQDELRQGMQAIEPKLEEAFIHLDYEENRGKGAALRYAVAYAQHSNPTGLTLYTDWDFPFTLGSYLDAIDALSSGAEVVLPVRDVTLYMSHLGGWRKFLSSSSRLMNRLLLNLPSSDTQGGIKAFNARGREAFLKTKISRFLFDTEFIAIATKEGLNIRLTSSTVRSGLVMSSMSWRTLKSELSNIPQLFRARWYS